jgi:S-adenosylmethionine synthetase
MVMVFGEITTKSSFDYQKVIRETVKRIGFTDSSIGKLTPPPTVERQFSFPAKINF